MRGGVTRGSLPAVACLCAVLASGCASNTETKPAGTEGPRPKSASNGGLLLPVSLPDLSRLEASVQEQVRKQYSLLMQQRENPGVPPIDLSNSYGEMGKLLMAAEHFDAAEPYCLNAQTLAPGEMRWPYYLGHLYRNKGALAESEASFERTLQLRPDDVAALVWLGEVYLADGRPEAAEPLFERALALQPRSVSARFGLGRAALAKKDYRGAVKHLEEALALDRQAVSIHYPLALAYRELGEADKADAHFRQRGDSEILPPDPLLQELKEILQSAISYEIRGTRALDGRDWAAAADDFRKGLELAPESASLRYKLGTALLLMGDARAAQEQFEQILRTSPQYAKAHYSLGMLMEASGRKQEAIDRFSAAVKYEPRYVDAHIRLAALLRRSGRMQESLSHYTEALKIDPGTPEASAGYAMALVALRRYQEARDWLIDAVKVHSDQPEFAHALARLLAAAPDKRVRDGQQAMAVMRTLSDEQQRLDLGETMAMTLAERGRYEEAAAWQRRAITAAGQAGHPDLAQRMVGSLRLYEAKKPCRTPWRDEDLP